MRILSVFLPILLLSACASFYETRWRPRHIDVQDTVLVCRVTGSRIPRARHREDCRRVTRDSVKEVLDKTWQQQGQRPQSR